MKFVPQRHDKSSKKIINYYFEVLRLALYRKYFLFEFVKENYNKMLLLKSLEKSIQQAKLQNSQELDEISLDDLIADVKNSTDS